MMALASSFMDNSDVYFNELADFPGWSDSVSESIVLPRAAGSTQTGQTFIVLARLDVIGSHGSEKRFRQRECPP